MKKNFMLYAAAASMMMLQACTTDETFTKNDVLVPGNSEMEIKLSSVDGGGTSTEIEEGTPRYFAHSRAAVTGDELTGMGVFCVAREKQAINDIPADIDWRDWSGCVMKNVQSNLSADGNVTWTDHYYYPISQFYAYDFYGYYPYVADDKITIGKENVQVQFTLTGKEDLIWGRATNDEDYAYSAKFFRINGNQEKLPTLDLKHMLTRLIFQVKTGEDYEGSATATEATKMKVKSLCIKSAKPHVNLNWTNTTASTSDASLTLRDNSVANFYLCDANGEQVQNFELTSEANAVKQIGESIMLYPEQSYILEVVLVNSETNEEFLTESPLTLSQADAKFEAGKNYTVTITVHGPKEIQLKAALNKWADADPGTNNNVEL